jgi:hypothetical protein
MQYVSDRAVSENKSPCLAIVAASILLLLRLFHLGWLLCQTRVMRGRARGGVVPRSIAERFLLLRMEKEMEMNGFSE